MNHQVEKDVSHWSINHATLNYVALSTSIAYLDIAFVRGTRYYHNLSGKGLNTSKVTLLRGEIAIFLLNLGVGFSMLVCEISM